MCWLFVVGELLGLVCCVLVFCVDYEFNVLVFVMCVVVLIGVSLYVVVSVGLVVLFGFQYGGVIVWVYVLIQQSLCQCQLDELVCEYLCCGDVLVGFGYLFYFDGDLCVGLLLDQLQVLYLWCLVMCGIQQLIVVVEYQCGLCLSLDFVLVVIVIIYGGLFEVGLVLFVVGRMVGWLVYVLEQCVSGGLICLCVIYVGILLVCDR